MGFLLTHRVVVTQHRFPFKFFKFFKKMLAELRNRGILWLSEEEKAARLAAKAVGGAALFL